jgi:class 3 adenylate cyclase
VRKPRDSIGGPAFPDWRPPPRCTALTQPGKHAPPAKSQIGLRAKRQLSLHVRPRAVQCRQTRAAREERAMLVGSTTSGAAMASIDERLLENKMTQIEHARSRSPRVISKFETLIRTGDEVTVHRANPLAFARNRGVAGPEANDLLAVSAVPLRPAVFRHAGRLVTLMGDGPAFDYRYPRGDHVAIRTACSAIICERRPEGNNRLP